MTVTALEEIVSADNITKRNGIFTIRKGFFYTMGGSADKFRDSVEAELINHDIRFETIEADEVYKAFKGGAPIVKQSHWYVKVRITD